LIDLNSKKKALSIQASPEFRENKKKSLQKWLQTT
jgi:hypothetical protein